MKNLLIAVARTCAMVSGPSVSFAADGEVKLSKKERKALDA